jgi:hypothetical protein
LERARIDGLEAGFFLGRAKRRGVAYAHCVDWVRAPGACTRYDSKSRSP